MAIVVPHVGMETLLGVALASYTAINNIEFRFYTNDVTPDENSDETTFTQASTSLILPHEVTYGDWTISSENGVTTATCPEVDIDVEGTVSLYGYYAWDSDNDRFLWAERFQAAPYNYGSGGGVLTFTPKLQFRSPWTVIV